MSLIFPEPRHDTLKWSQQAADVEPNTTTDVYLSFATPSNTRVPGLGDFRIKDNQHYSWYGYGYRWGLQIPLTNPEDVPVSMRRMLDFIRVVDICGTEKIADAVAAIASYMTSLQVLRIVESKHAASLSWPRLVRAPVVIVWVFFEASDTTSVYDSMTDRYSRTDRRLVMSPAVHLAQGTELLVINALAFDNAEFSTLPASSAWDEVDYPQTLQNVVVCYDTTFVPQLWEAAVGTFFRPRHFCDNLGAVTYTFTGWETATENGMLPSSLIPHWRKWPDLRPTSVPTMLSQRSKVALGSCPHANISTRNLDGLRKTSTATLNTTMVNSSTMTGFSSVIPV